MHPRLNNVKAPIEIHTSFSFRCLSGKQLEDGKIAGLGQFELCLGFRKAFSRTLACHRQRAMCLSDHAQICFHAWSQAFVYGIEKGAPLSISGVPLARITYPRQCSHPACSNAGLTIFRATYLDNTPTDLRAMGSAKP